MKRGLRLGKVKNSPSARGVKPLRVDSITYALSLLFGSNYYVRYRLPGTDIDFLAYDDVNDELIAVEVKTKVDEENIDKVILQLDFRRHIANRVYLAVPERDVYYALMMVPIEYGVLGVRGYEVSVYRRSRFFNPSNARWLKQLLFK